jgi:predicted DNA-binding antitoxin AbrB/MazE fold protein
MSITIEATYEGGVLIPVSPLPFKEHEKVRLTVEPKLSLARRTAGMLAWSGDAATFDRILNESIDSFQEDA